MTAMGTTADGSGDEASKKAQVVVEADDDTHLYDISATLANRRTAGVGAAIVTLVFGKDVEAGIGSGGSTTATGDITVSAGGVDRFFIIVASVGGAGTAGVAGNIATFVFCMPSRRPQAERLPRSRQCERCRKRRHPGFRHFRRGLHRRTAGVGAALSRDRIPETA